MTEAQTIPAKYIFLDVVSFTHNRSVEAQTDIVHALNKIVAESIAEFEIERDSVIYLPTGDGICITLLNIVNPFDIHILIALSILKKLSEHNEKAEEDEQKFEVRIGINANDDNLVTDINGKQNIAGEGINMAARVMSKADGNQILVGEMVFETLRSRKKYMNKFKGFNAEVKHGRQMKVYQYIAEGAGLNQDMPKAFQISKKEVLKLNKLAAYYFAQAIKNRNFLIQHNNVTKRDACRILLFFLARDSVKQSETTEINKPVLETYKAGKIELEEQLKYYDSLDLGVKWLLRSFISEKLSEYYQYFENTDQLFINSNGTNKLKLEWKQICDELGID